ncbi:MAG: ribulokinase, partial [Anaerolineales bacterium]
GSAMFGAIAAGSEVGGYDTIYAASQAMARLKEHTFKPNPQNQPVYDRLYREYLRLHDTFGRGENNVMKTLKNIRAETKQRANREA